jgi:apolipoprotein N-acyltransferase
LSYHSYKQECTNINALIVQPSLPHITSIGTTEDVEYHLMRHLILSKDEEGIDVVIWSENALPLPFSNILIKKLLQGHLKPNTLLITASLRQENGKDYVSLIGTNHSLFELFHHDKVNLVPFGEYIPFYIDKIFDMKHFVDGGFYSFEKGNAPSVIKYSINQNKILKFKPIICYESIFTNNFKNNSEYDVVINITNDFWFGKSFGTYQHLEAARARAVEYGVPVIRVANSGISAVILPNGDIIKKTKLFEVTNLKHCIPTKLEEETIYAKIMSKLFN